MNLTNTAALRKSPFAQLGARFLNFKLVWTDNKFVKLPFIKDKPAKGWTKLPKLLTLGEACEFSETNPDYGVAISMIGDHGLVVIDVDKQRADSESNWSEKAQAVLSATEGCWTELSASRRGLHIVCKAELAQKLGNDEIELFGDCKYFVGLTGDVLRNGTFAECDIDPIVALRERKTSLRKAFDLNELKAKRDDVTIEMLPELLEGITCDELSYDEWLTVLMGAKHQFGEEAREAVESWSMDDARYDADSFSTKWASISQAGNTTVGTLLHLSGKTLTAAGSLVDRPFKLSMLPHTEKTKSGVKVMDTIENLECFLTEGLGATVRYNVISKGLDVNLPGLNSWTEDNKDESILMNVISNCNRVGIPSKNVGGYLISIADRNLYNPVGDWVTSAAWDGVDRIQALAATLGVPAGKEALRDVLVRKWLIGAVAAATEPRGAAQGGVLVLAGDQGIGKTSWFNALTAGAPEGLSLDGHSLDTENKDSVLKAVSHWLVELGELGGTLKKDLDKLKAFLTSDSDEVRRPYARTSSHYARRTAFMATVNGKEFLKDPTGNRRFWVLDCNSINYKHSIEMQQVWAQALALHKKGESRFLTQSELEMLNDNNQDFRQRSDADDKLDVAFNWDSKETEFYSMVQIRQIARLDDDRKVGAAINSYMASKGLKQTAQRGIRGFILPKSNQTIEFPL